MVKEYLLTIDQSTSGTKGLIVDQEGKIIRSLSINHHQIYPHPGWVEHNPVEIYENVKKIINELVESSRIPKEKFAALTITNQRETIVAWDKKTGKPVYNAIVWQCRRTTKMCQNLVDTGYELVVNKKTGLTIDPYFSASKIKWILENVVEAKEKAYSGQLLIGTIDSWLIWNLTKGQTHATDITNASRTLLYNIYTNQWDEELLQIFGIPSSILPKVKNSDEIFGEILDSDIELINVPITGVIGDSQGSLFGQQCFEKGLAKATFGTGTSILVYTEDPVKGNNGLVTTVAWGINGQVYYALEGIINMSGDIIKWMKEDLKLFQDFNELEVLVQQIEDNGGVYLIPAFIGLGAPYWKPNARAAFFGMSRSTNKNHLIRAGLESIAYQVKDIVELINNESDISIKEFRVDGGATRNRFLMQYLANVLDLDVFVSKTSELSALGATYIGGLSVGIWKSINQLKALNKYVIYHSSNDEKYQLNYKNWKKYVLQLLK